MWRRKKNEENYTRLTDSLIEALGDAATGAKYSFTDDTITKEVRYYYSLEQIDTCGSDKIPITDLFRQSLKRKNQKATKSFFLLLLSNQYIFIMIIKHFCRLCIMTTATFSNIITIVTYSTIFGGGNILIIAIIITFGGLYSLTCITR